jgi:hypothetical protein
VTEAWDEVDPTNVLIADIRLRSLGRADGVFDPGGQKFVDGQALIENGLLATPLILQRSGNLISDLGARSAVEAFVPSFPSFRG